MKEVSSITDCHEVESLVKKKKLLWYEMARFCIVKAYTSLKLHKLEAVVAVCCALHKFLMPNCCSVLHSIEMQPRRGYIMQD